MPKNRERLTRSFTSAIETRADEGGKKHITGVIPYDKEADLDYFREVIRHGAFTKTLQESDVRALWAHNTQYVLGRTSAGTFTIEDRQDGLHFDIEVPPLSWADDVYESIRRGDAPGVSFGFSVIKDAWTDSQNASVKDLRELLEVKLYEISVGVAFPAYEDSTSEASTRSLFSSRGIDLERLGAVLFRAKRKGGENDCKLSKADDIEAVKSAIESLSAILPEERSAGAATEQPEGSTAQPEEPTKADSTAEEEEQERERLALELELANSL